MKRNKIKTKIPEIIAYWREHAQAAGLKIGPPWAEAGIRCWRCSEVGNTDRAHIVPHGLGGTDEPGNLVLLCYLCHLEGPNVDDPTFMLQWITATRVEPEEFLGDRMVTAYRSIYGRVPYAGFPAVPDVMDRFKRHMKALIGRVVGHDGRLNATTSAWLVRQVEDLVRAELTNEAAAADAAPPEAMR